VRHYEVRVERADGAVAVFGMALEHPAYPSALLRRVLDLGPSWFGSKTSASVIEPADWRRLGRARHGTRHDY
jgi:hypothetical protein